MMRHPSILGLVLTMCLCCTERTAPVSHGDTPGRVVISRVVMGKRVRTSRIASGYVKVTAPSMSSHMTYALTVTDTGFSAEIRMPDEGDTFYVEVGFRDSDGSLLGWDRDTIVYGADQTTATATFAIEAAARALATLSVTPDTTAFLAENGTVELAMTIDTTDAYGEIVSFLWDTTGDSTWDVIEPAEGRVGARRTVGPLPAGAGMLLCGFKDSEGDSALMSVNVYVSTPPNDPVLIMPLDGRRGAWVDYENGTGSVELRFTTSDPDTTVDSLTVRVLAGPDRAGLAPVTAVTESTAVIEGLTTSGTCHWEIAVTDRAGQQKSLTGSFQTFPPAPEGMVGIPAKGMVATKHKPSDYSTTLGTIEMSYDVWMDTIEVTQADYARLMNVKPYSDSLNLRPARFPGETRPVENVSYYAAILYCNRRSLSEGLDTLYMFDAAAYFGPEVGTLRGLTLLEDSTVPKPGYRLPLDTEWEFAYRSGESAKYYWGEDDPNTITAMRYAWFVENVGDTTGVGSGPQRGGQKLPNTWGLYDMAGNLREWCYVGITVGMLDEHNFVTRGGGWCDALEELSATGWEDNTNLFTRGDKMGFRCVRIIKE